jgi:hypothetical protein
MGKPMPLLGGTTPLREDDGIQADNQGYASYPMRLGHESRLLSTFATAGLKMLLVRGFGWLVVH